MNASLPNDTQFTAPVKQRLFDLASDARLRGETAFADTCDLARAGDLRAFDQVLAAMRFEVARQCS